MSHALDDRVSHDGEDAEMHEEAPDKKPDYRTIIVTALIGCALGIITAFVVNSAFGAFSEQIVTGKTLSALTQNMKSIDSQISDLRSEMHDWRQVVATRAELARIEAEIGRRQDDQSRRLDDINRRIDSMRQK